MTRKIARRAYQAIFVGGTGLEPPCSPVEVRWRAGSFFMLSVCGNEKSPNSASIWITAIFKTIFAMFVTAVYTRAERFGKGFLIYDGGIIGSLLYNAGY